MLSRYLALGFVSDFDWLPESRILKDLLRAFEFLPNKPRFYIPRAWEQLQPSTRQKPAFQVSPEQTPQPGSRGHLCPLVVSHQIITVSSGSRISSDSSFDTSGKDLSYGI